MKTAHQVIALVGFLVRINALGQGVFQYDQESANESTGGGTAIGIQANQLIGQSYTPTLDSVGFIRLAVSDAAFDGIGATLFVNLRTDSINGTIIGTTDAIQLQDGFVGYVNFIFAMPISVTPEVTYFFQPVAQGGGWAVRSYSYAYPRGTAFNLGVASPGFGLWFREGIIVPEPSAIVLVAMGGSLLWYLRERRCRP